MKLREKIKKWTDKSIVNKLYLTFISLFLLTFLSVIGITYTVNVHTYRSQAETYNYQILNLFSEKMDTILTQIDRLSFFAYQADIQHLLGTEAPNAAWAAHRNSVLELEFQSFKTFFNFDFQVNGAYFISDGELLMEFPNYSYYKDDIWLDNEWTQKVAAEKGRKVFFRESELALPAPGKISAENDFHFITARWIFGSFGSDCKGVLLFDLVIPGIPALMEQMHLPAETGLFILDGAGECLYSFSSQGDNLADTVSVADSVRPGSSFMVRSGSGKKYLVNTFSSSETPWTYLLASDYSFLTAPARNLNLFICMIGILFCIAALLLGRHLIRGITNPLSLLQFGMQKIAENDYSERLTVTEENEIGDLKKTFNLMADRIDYLINCVYLEQLKEKQAKLNALQSQINPHFLYNALGTIGAMALLDDKREIYQMATSLSDMFRYAVKQDEGPVPLEAELANLENYIRIQSYRYGERLKFHMEVPEEVKKYPLLPFTLQPLVENAIHHGLEPKPAGGTISLQARQLGSQICITVTDDGVGIEEAKLKELNLLLSVPPAASVQSDHIGLLNVYERLFLYYDGNASLTLVSSPDTGTVCTLLFCSIPS